jgi:2-C-methyl-D-erythritol 4-phosphate cytidylyltransferase
MKKYAIIAAGGSGIRMGSNIPKQYIELKGKPILWHTLDTFLKAYDDINIILVVARDYLEMGENILQYLNPRARITLITGGPTRFDSVKNGLQHVHHLSIVFIHDGVRCLLSTQLIHRCYENALEHGNAVPAISAVDSVRIQNNGGNEIIPREKVKLIQTPQTFNSEILKRGYAQSFNEAFTDEASVVERLGIRINLIAGEETNIKITRPIDLIIAEKILEERMAIG